MKKTILSLAVVLSCGLLTSCGTMGTMGGGNNTGAGIGQSVLGGASATDLIGNLISTFASGIMTNQSSIVGTWTYAQPQVSFESNNALGQIGGELMANSLEKQLSTQLEKIGLKAGVSKFTFDNNGNVAMTMGGKTTNGTYQLNGNQLTMTGALGVAKLTSTVTINANQLYMLFDASTLFTSLTKLGSNISTLSSLLKNFNGMKLGWSMTK